jgi:hypothetical protein
VGRELSRHDDWLLVGRPAFYSLGEFFLSRISSIPTFWATQPATERVSVIVPLELKRQGREFDHPSPSNAESKNDVECRLLGYDTEWLLQEPTFRRNASPLIMVTRIEELGITLAMKHAPNKYYF